MIGGIVMTDKELFDIAKEAVALSRAPYSGFNVGAALLCKNGKVYKGANIENAAYSATVCAERTAVFRAVLDGETEFVSIAVAAKNQNGEYVSAPPCGTCRQVLSEFCKSDFKVIFGTDDNLNCITLNDILPYSFLLL